MPGAAGAAGWRAKTGGKLDAGSRAAQEQITLFNIGILSYLVWGQAGADPEFQALLARQAGEDCGDADAGGLTAQEKGAGLASVFKRDDGNLAARCAPALLEHSRCFRAKLSIRTHPPACGLESRCPSHCCGDTDAS